jgi:hypothetical protein
LTVAYLGDWLRANGNDLGLTIVVLRDWDHRGRVCNPLGLPVANLCHWGRDSCRGLRLSISCFTNDISGAARENVDENSIALRSPIRTVEVRETPTRTFIEDSGATESQRGVGKDRESSGVDSTCLRGRVELELVVGSDISCPALSIGENTVGKSNGKVSGLSAIDCLTLRSVSTGQNRTDEL